MNYETLIQSLPGVMPPTKRLSFKEKIKWTLLALLLYFIMSQIYIWGISPSNIHYLQEMSTLFGASIGTIITLGIGPIVTSSIILQMLMGTGLLGWDTSTHHGKIMFQGTQKILSIILCVVEAVVYTLMGAVQPINFATTTLVLIIFQIALGGWIILFLDEIVSKWGFGSGISLFIAAGISKDIILKLISPMTSSGTMPLAGESAVGLLPNFIKSISSGAPDIGLLLPVFMTIVIFVIVVYAQAMRVEIPLAYGSVRGFGRKWPLKFIYTNVLPVILTAALLINIKVWSKLLYDRGITIFGTFSQTGQPISGFVHYLSPPTNFIWNLLNFNIIGDEVLRVITYTIFMVLGSVVFSIFWVESAGMGSNKVAQQIQQSGMQIPGFRRDIRVMETILERYIPNLAIMGGAFVGFLAAFSDFAGALTSGTGLLLTVMIIYQLYEQIATQHIEDLHPSLKKFIKS
ncbi:MAG: preprotein translocase subunit SecY [DPANN group archaeon]|nr:preprotein translocase subunit SecY [DPANN group archaeon]